MQELVLRNSESLVWFLRLIKRTRMFNILVAAQSGVTVKIDVSVNKNILQETQRVALSSMKQYKYISRHYH
jgi:hypothetical protein